MNEDDYKAIKQKFADFAIEHGLDRFPVPDGERYICWTDLDFAGKKSECTDFIDDLWNALVRSQGREDLCIPVQ